MPLDLNVSEIPTFDPQTFIGKQVKGTVTQAWDNSASQNKHKYIVELHDDNLWAWEGLCLTHQLFDRELAEQLIGTDVDFLIEQLADRKPHTFIGKLRPSKNQKPEKKVVSTAISPGEAQVTREGLNSPTSAGDFLLRAARELYQAGQLLNKPPF